MMSSCLRRRSRPRRWLAQTMHVVAASTLVLAAACDSPPSAPTVPPASSPLPPPPFLLADMRVTGRVLDERGLPIAGAAVSVIGHPVSTVSSSAGAFEVSGTIGSRWGTQVLVTRDGYEPDYQVVPFAPEAVYDIHLRAPVVIRSGDAATVVIAAHDTLYGTSEQYRARRIRIVAGGTGQLVVDATSTSARPALLSDGPFENSVREARLIREVLAGEEVLIHVVHELTAFVSEPVAYALTTRLEHR